MEETRPVTRARVDLLAEVDRIIRESHSTEDALGEVVNLLVSRGRRFSWVGVYLRLSGRLELGPWAGRDHPPHPRSAPLDRGPLGLAASLARTVYLPELRGTARWLACPAEARSEIVVPVVLEGRVAALLDADARRPNSVTVADRGLLEAVAERLAARKPVS